MGDVKRYRVVITSEVECLPEDAATSEYGDTPHDAAETAIVGLGLVGSVATFGVTDLETGARWTGRAPGMDFERVP